ncbi:MAG TPA: energy transducer TonB [Candidatus Dormibacteraeota bacterium]|nr:energy transducer TonB [Candidatus Dormibacteraeota bacterium]
MSATLQLEEVVEVHDAPKLIVEWSSPWREFVESVRPALSRSQARLAGEAPFGLVPLRIMVPSYVIEAFVILAAIFVQVKIAELRPYVAPRISSHDVIYYSGDELPRTEDLGGAETGAIGRAGGSEAHHRTQTIKVARGGSLVPKVVDAPNLRLPSSRDAVANLLAIKPDAGPPPAEGLRSTRTAPRLAATLVAPAPNVIRDYTRNGIQLDPVIAPAPSVTRDRPLTAPNLSATLVPPAPNVASDHTLVAPALAPVVLPPSPSVSRDHTPVAPSLSASVAAPSPNVSRDPFRSTLSLPTSVVPPAPASVTRQLSAAPVQTMDAAVVPPPVSAPERATSRSPRLSMPAPSVVAPPPSTNVSADMRRLASGSVPDPGKAVVPPPPSPSSSSFMSGLIGKIFGPTEVVAPPPSVNARGTSGATPPSLANNVAPPPVAIGATDAGGNPRGNRNGAGAALTANVVAPPPSAGLSGGSGTPSRAAAAPYLGNASIVPPPPALAGTGGGTGNTGGAAGQPSGRLLADNVVPPPPGVGAGSSAGGSGLGRRGPGLGAPADAGSGLAPPTSGGSGKDAGTVISSQPGTKLGLPTVGSKGSIAMSPAGGDKPGLGGAGGGSGIGKGEGPGSGMKGSDTGAGKVGSGHGSDANARGGISPTNGYGGAGSANSGTPAVPGVDISGGSVTVSFDNGAASDPTVAAARNSLKKSRSTLQADVVSTASAAGAFEPYKNLLRGEKHTTYLDTSSGTVVMEYAETSPRAGSGVLAPPQDLRTDLPEGLPHARMVIACVLDASGNVRNPRVLEAGPAVMTAKILRALSGWKFQPAMRNNQPVEVTAILGFGIDTNDRF